MIIKVSLIRIPISVFHFKDRGETVGIVLIRLEDTEVFGFGIQLEDVADII